MPYDLELARRIREILGARKGVTEREMFGGIAFMLADKMFVGVIGDDLMARVGPEAHASALEKPHVRPMDFSGRPMKGYVYVAPKGVATGAALLGWVDACAAHAATLPEKRPRRKRTGPTSRGR